MPRMLDLIRESKVPANLMQSAARGSLSVPSKMVEIRASCFSRVRKTSRALCILLYMTLLRI